MHMVLEQLQKGLCPGELSADHYWFEKYRGQSSELEKMRLDAQNPKQALAREVSWTFIRQVGSSWF